MSNINASGNTTSLLNSGVVTIASVRSEYERADCFCAEVQSFRGQAGIPAINELRNAGKHLLDAVDDSGNVVSQTDLDSALGHSRRAAYEAYEAGILTALEIIAKFKKDYSLISVSQIMPRYSEIMQQALAAQKAVEAGRRRDFRRDADHSDRMDAFRSLREACEYLDANREEANKLVSKERTSGRTSVILLVLAVLGLVFGAPSFLDWVGKRDWSPEFLKASAANP